ncbi:MAG TPA: glycosyltransferase family 39 protein [Pyrinomonadaceae bacterium]|nr:glycosyltransferase family 39 protein [Pyrinomonadaceae bacterium]
MNPTHPATNKPVTANDSSRRSHSVAATPPTDSAKSFWKSWPWWLTPSLIALLLVLLFVDPFIGDWDGMDYTMLSLAGYPSSMALGRNLFIFGNHALYKIASSLFNVQPENAYLIFKYAVVAQVPFAVIACWVLARDFTKSVHAATLAALFIAVSPVFVLYGGQVMTDVPSVLLLAVALFIHYRGLREERIWKVMLGAALLGLGMNLRETIGFYAPWLVFAPFVCGWKLQRRHVVIIILACLLFLLCAGGWFAYWFLTVDHYRGIWFGWRESMRQETARHPITLQNLKPYLTYFFVSAPLVFVSLAFAFRNEWRERRMSPLLLLGLTGLFANLLLFLNYSTSVNWRYFLTGLPALAPLSASFLIRTLGRRFGSVRLAFISCLVALLTLGVVFSLLIRPASRQFIERRAMSKQYRYQLEKLPRDAVMISGSQTIAVTYWKAIGLGEWQTIGTGGGWPGDDFVPLIENYLKEGRRVFLDADPRWWLPCGWQRDEIPVIVRLQEQFRFRRVTDTIYEIRPPFEKGVGADEHPHLERLLPENRPEDTKKCPLVSS